MEGSTEGTKKKSPDGVTVAWAQHPSVDATPEKNVYSN